MSLRVIGLEPNEARIAADMNGDLADGVTANPARERVICAWARLAI
jgi:hypothetical protein